MKTKSYIIAMISVIAGVFLDQYTKFLAVTHLKDAPFSIIDGVFELRYLENRGAAFGILQNQQIFLNYRCTVISFLQHFIYKTSYDKAYASASNLYDRDCCGSNWQYDRSYSP